MCLRGQACAVGHKGIGLFVKRIHEVAQAWRTRLNCTTATAATAPTSTSYATARISASASHSTSTGGWVDKSRCGLRNVEHCGWISVSCGFGELDGDGRIARPVREQREEAVCCRVVARTAAAAAEACVVDGTVAQCEADQAVVRVELLAERCEKGEESLPRCVASAHESGPHPG